MQHQDDNQPAGSPVVTVVVSKIDEPSPCLVGCESGTGEAHFIPNGRSVPARNVLTWITDAWGLLTQRPGAAAILLGSLENGRRITA